MERIRILEIDSFKAPKLIEVAHTLENLHELVGGTPQIVYGHFQIAFWKDGHVDSGSTRRIIDCLASR